MFHGVLSPIWEQENKGEKMENWPLRDLLAVRSNLYDEPIEEKHNVCNTFSHRPVVLDI